MSANAVEPSSRLMFTSSLQASLARAARMVACPIKYPPGQEPAEFTTQLFERPLFDSSRKAVLFAVTREGNPARPYFSRILDKTIGGAGTGLSGNDGAAQAGVIMSVIRRLGTVSTATLIASCAPASVDCECKRSCCGGKKLFTPWHDAIGVLADASVLVPCRAIYPLRLAILVKLYAKKLKLAEIAEQLELDADTVAKHHKTITRWLHGAPAGKNGEPAVVGIESEAWKDAESTLRNHGIVG